MLAQIRREMALELTRDDLKSALRANTDRVPRWSWQHDDLFVRFNFHGRREPLYWCFNNWMEPICLSRALHPEQPLVAMHSLYGVLKGKAVKAANLETVANLYADGILERAGSAPITIGGNCQAGPIAEAVAQAILARTRVPPLLIFLEHMPRLSYPGPVMLLFGSKSERYNPFLRGIDPLPQWQAQFGSFSWHLLAGEHGAYFQAPALNEFAGLVTEAMSSRTTETADSR